MRHLISVVILCLLSSTAIAYWRGRPPAVGDLLKINNVTDLLLINGSGDKLVIR